MNVPVSVNKMASSMKNYYGAIIFDSGLRYTTKLDPREYLVGIYIITL